MIPDIIYKPKRALSMQKVYRHYTAYTLFMLIYATLSDALSLLDAV